MQCEICQSKTATVHLTDVSNNEKKEIHLCEGCAQQQGTTIKSHMNKEPSYPDFKPHELMTADVAESESEDSALVCPKCGITFRKFRSTGKFGCPEDYEIFGSHVVQLLEKIHHRVQHTGKIPARTSRKLTIQKEVQQLRGELQESIKREQYERAAEIRDKIYSLEGRLEKHDE